MEGDVENVGCRFESENVEKGSKSVIYYRKGYGDLSKLTKTTEIVRIL